MVANRPAAKTWRFARNSRADYRYTGSLQFILHQLYLFTSTVVRVSDIVIVWCYELNHTRYAINMNKRWRGRTRDAHKREGNHDNILRNLQVVLYVLRVHKLREASINVVVLNRRAHGWLQAYVVRTTSTRYILLSLNIKYYALHTSVEG